MEDIAIILTGRFRDGKDNIKDQLAKLGVKIARYIHKKCVLVCGENPREMVTQEAKLVGVPIVTESFLRDLLAGSSPDPRNYKYTIADYDESPVKTRKRRNSEILMTDKSSGSSKRIKLSTESNVQLSPRSKRHHGDERYVIALEGLIGIGKSTLCNKLVEQFPEDCDVYKEQTNEHFLQLFYRDPKKYGFALQWGMLKSRIYQLKLAQHDVKYGRIPPCKFYYWDRSMIGDYIFALWNHLQGGISKEEMAVYESEFGGSIRELEKVPFMTDIHLFVFMNDEPHRCKERVETCRKNPSEMGIPLAYYEGLDDMHFHIMVNMLMKKISKVLVLTWGQYDNPTEMQMLFADVLSGKKKLPTVEVVNYDDVPLDCLVYKSEADITSFHGMLRDRSNTPVVHARKQYDTVYIAQNIMMVSPESKGVVNYEDYGITFYQNAYKRVVMWHLAQGQNIAFFRLP